MSYTITEQDRKLLDLIARGESQNASNPYAAIYPNGEDPRIPNFTLSQLKEYQTERRRRPGNGDAAAGRYQFIGETLWGKWNGSSYPPGNNNYADPGTEFIKVVGVSMSTVYSANFQDWLIVQRLIRYRKYNDWLEGSISTKDFQLRLAQEIASVPVPDSDPPRSYYQGDGLNAAKHNSDVFYYELVDIRRKGPGQTSNLQFSEAPYQPLGNSAIAQSSALAGGGRPAYGGASESSPYVSTLPAAKSPYTYKPIDILDNRYDFRLGEKVRDLLINGVNPANKGTGSALAPASSQIGTSAFNVMPSTQPTSPYGPRVVTETVNTPAGPKTVTKTYAEVNTPAGVKTVDVTGRTPAPSTPASDPRR